MIFRHIDHPGSLVILYSHQPITYLLAQPQTSISPARPKTTPLRIFPSTSRSRQKPADRARCLVSPCRIPSTPIAYLPMSKRTIARVCPTKNERKETTQRRFVSRYYLPQRFQPCKTPAQPCSALHGILPPLRAYDARERDWALGIQDLISLAAEAVRGSTFGLSFCELPLPRNDDGRQKAAGLPGGDAEYDSPLNGKPEISLQSRLAVG